MPADKRWEILLIRGYAGLMTLLGLALGIGGIRLLLLGGSPYYVAAGAAIVVAGVLLYRRNIRGVWIYAAFLVATSVWAIWESGIDPWALAPRLAAPTIFGLWLLAPWSRRALGARTIARVWWVGGLFVVVGLTAWGMHAAGPESGADKIVSSPAAATDWQAWGNSKGGTRFAQAAQLTPKNVGLLDVAWTFETGAAPRPGGSSLLAFEASPLKVGNALYLCTPHNVVFAIDAVTGKQIWKFDPKTNDKDLRFVNCRGIAYASIPGLKSGTPCAERLYVATIDARMLAIDAKSGAYCDDWGSNGKVDLREGLPPHVPSHYLVTSPPTVSGDVVVTGALNLDSGPMNETSGVVRAYDLVTGKLAWAFDPGDPDRDGLLKPGQTYVAGTPNVWSVASTDERLGLIYLPFGSTTPDHFGAYRTPNVEKFSNAIVAVDNKTGKVRWTFQVVHHDLWNYDISAQPVLTDFRAADGKAVPALISVSKTGETFVLDRATGKTLTRVEEKPVPRDGVREDFTSPTQPFSVDMPSFAGPVPTEARMWGLTPFDQLWCRIEFRKLRFHGRYTPPNTRLTMMYPGTGGVNWGSVAIDEARHLLIVNSLNMPETIMLVRRKAGTGPSADADDHPSFNRTMLTLPMAGTPYLAKYGSFLSPLKTPCVQPPWGRISAVDLNTHKLVWTRRIGMADRMGPLGLESHLPFEIGLPQIGGSVATAGGLTFISATPDRRLRAYESATGRLLWQGDLPANGNANPITYVGADGRQYVVISAGGSGLFAPNKRNALVAFALPRNRK